MRWQQSWLLVCAIKCLFFSLLIVLTLSTWVSKLNSDVFKQAGATITHRNKTQNSKVAKSHFSRSQLYLAKPHSTSPDFSYYNHKSISLATSVGLRQRNSILDTRFDQYDPFLNVIFLFFSRILYTQSLSVCKTFLALFSCAKTVYTHSTLCKEFW